MQNNSHHETLIHQHPLSIGQNLYTGRRKPRKYKEDTGVQGGLRGLHVGGNQNEVLGTTLITCKESQPIKEPQVTPLPAPSILIG